MRIIKHVHIENAWEPDGFFARSAIFCCHWGSTFSGRNNQAIGPRLSAIFTYFFQCFVWSSIVTFVFLGFALFLPHKSEAFFSFEEGCAFVECALVLEKDSWESSLSQMAISISSTGRSPAFLKSFFFLFKDITVLRRGGRI